MNDLARKIKELRESRGWTLEELGNRVGVSKSTIHKWESGSIENMRRDKLGKIADAFDVSPAYLMGWDEESQEDINQGEFIAEICKKLMQLDESAQASVLALIDHLLSIKSTN